MDDFIHSTSMCWTSLLAGTQKCMDSPPTSKKFTVGEEEVDYANITGQSKDILYFAKEAQERE